MSIISGIAKGLEGGIRSIPEQITEKAKGVWNDARDTAGQGADIVSDVVSDSKVRDAARDEGKRRLNDEERALAQEYFGGSINLDKVYINESSALVQANRHLPENEREDGSKPENGRPFAFGNTINFSRELDLSDPDDAGLFIHELTHVWQFQSVKGAQTTIEGIQGQSYDLDTDALKKPGSSIHDFNIEQQGEITYGHVLLSRHEELTGMLNDPAVDPFAIDGIVNELADIENNGLYEELNEAGVTSENLDPFLDEIRNTSPREGVTAESDELLYESLDAAGEGADEITREGMEAGEEIFREAREGDVIGVGAEVVEGTLEGGREVIEGTVDTAAEVGEGALEIGREGAKKVYGWLT